jgi:hypothetical protein
VDGLLPLPLAGEGWGGGSLRNGSGDCFENADTIFHYIVIAEAEHFEALRFDHGRASRIRVLSIIRGMLATIELDHELGRVAESAM